MFREQVSISRHPDTRHRRRILQLVRARLGTLFRCCSLCIVESPSSNGVSKPLSRDCGTNATRCYNGPFMIDLLQAMVGAAVLLPQPGGYGRQWCSVSTLVWRMRPSFSFALRERHSRNLTFKRRESL